MRDPEKVPTGYIGKRKTKNRTVVSSAKYGYLVLSIAEEGIWIRQLGRRTVFLLPHGVAYQYAVELHVQRERDAKPSNRARRKR